MKIISYTQRIEKKCRVDGCNRLSQTKDLCSTHYQQIRRCGKITSIRLRIDSDRKCKILGCKFFLYGKGYCIYHYRYFSRKKHIHKCLEKGCTKYSWKNNYCKKHQFRFEQNYPLDLKIDCRKIHMSGNNNPNFTGRNFEYPNHSLMKKNRLIVLARYPVCQKCKSKPSREVHHRNENKSDHRLKNLMATCRSCNAKIRFAPNVKYREIYGMTLQEIADKFGGTMGHYRELHRKNRLGIILKN